MTAFATAATPARIGRYRITGTLGHGGMGTVYRGHDDTLARDVAVKVIHDRFGSADNVIRRFGEEAKSVARLSSPHIVQVYEFDPLAAPAFAAEGVALATHAESGRPGWRLLVTTSSIVLWLGLTIAGWFGILVVTARGEQSLRDISSLQSSSLEALGLISLSSLLIGGAALGHRRSHPWLIGFLNMCSPLGSALAAAVCLFPGRTPR
jgi:hypothetical protein